MNLTTGLRKAIAFDTDANAEARGAEADDARYLRSARAEICSGTGHQSGHAGASCAFAID